MGLFDFLSKKPEIKPEIQYFNEGKKCIEKNKSEINRAFWLKSLEIKSDTGVPFQDTSVFGIMLSMGGYTESVDYFDKAIAIKPDFADAWFYRGLALLELRQCGDSPSTYEVTRNGKTKKIVVVRRQLSEAIESFDRAITVDPSHAEAWLYRGIALHYWEKYSEAIASFDKTISIKPEIAEVWFYRAGTLWKLHQLTEALTSFDMAISIKPDNAEAWFYRGILKRELGQNLEVESSYEWWYYRGIVLSTKGLSSEAIDSFNKAISLKPDCADAWYSQGVVQHRVGKYSEALDSINRAIAIKPDYKEAKLRQKDILFALKSV
jgi:tetratricopeptide (TPR) repeat protein